MELHEEADGRVLERGEGLVKATETDRMRVVPASPRKTP